MKSGIYVSEVDGEYKIKIPPELVKKISITPGDNVEVLIKKIKTAKRKIVTSDNDLLDILNIGEDET